MLLAHDAHTIRIRFWGYLREAGAGRSAVRGTSTDVDKGALFMASPLETIADALIAFILSLIRDPQAAAEFAADPAGGLAGHNLSDACMGDLAVVRPVIIDRSDVVARTQPDPPPPRTPSDTDV